LTDISSFLKTIEPGCRVAMGAIYVERSMGNLTPEGGLW